MSKPRLPYLNKEINRYGTVCWYVRKYPGPRIRIKEKHGSPEFMAAYFAALNGEIIPPEKRKKKPSTESLEWLIERYRDSTPWMELSQATKRQRENIFLRVIKDAGSTPYGEIDKADIVAGRDRRRETPSAANNFINTMRGLFEWASEAGFIKDNPTAGVKGIKRPNNGGFHKWTEEEVEKFEKRWPIGTRERLAMSILIYTGLRRGDAAMLGKQHIRDGEISIRTEKTDTPVTIPMLKILRDIIAASPTGDLALIAHARTGNGMSKEGFGNWFKRACKDAGVPGSCHGLRKIAATRCAEAGATIHELNAIFGWKGTQMASLYTEEADRKRLARGAAGKLEGQKKNKS